jgi:hypothetical protein
MPRGYDMTRLSEMTAQIARDHGLRFRVENAEAGIRLVWNEPNSRAVSSAMPLERMAIWLEGFSEALRVARARLGLKPDVLGQALQGLEDGPEGDRLP